MRAGDDEIVPAAEEPLLQDFGQRRVVELPIQDGFHLRVAALHGVADHDEIGVRRDILRAITFEKRDAFAFEEGGHRRVNVLVRAGDGEAAFAQSRRDRSHGGAADAEEMEMTRRFSHAAFFTPRPPFGY